MRNPFRGLTSIEILIVFALIVFPTLAVFPTGMFVSEEKAVEALEVQGFSDIEITHRAIWCIMFRGGEYTDAVRFTAIAKNPIDKPVTVYVFSGWLFKGATIRSL